jgi:MraZ protein
MVIGEYTSKIGDKKRISLPKKLRKELGNNLILTRGYENALVLVNKDMWQTIAKDVVSGSFINSKIRDTSRFLVGSAVEVNTDSQGRFVIPQALYEHATLNKEVVFIGLVNWVEVWDKKKWEERVKYLQENGDQIAEEISKMSNNNNG